MSDNFMQLDELIESDVLEALGETVPKDLVDDAGGKIANIPEGLAEILTQTESLEIDKDGTGEDIEDIGEIEILPMAEIESALDEQEEEDTTISMGSTNTNELVSVLSQLLNNKTIEITIKIKD
jgi:hypothetical protein